MNARLAILYIYIAAFLVGLAKLAFLPSIVWQYLGPIDSAIIALYMAAGFGTILMAYWHYTDDERLELLERQSVHSQNRIYELEKKHPEN